MSLIITFLGRGRLGTTFLLNIRDLRRHNIKIDDKVLFPHYDCELVPL
jgi:hypothetical protein